MKACVVVPARDEAAHVADCITALMAQTGVEPADYAVLLVDDRSTDGTRAVALAAARAHGRTLTVLDGPGAGAGAARRVGMDAAVARMGPDGLIASTDADSVVAPDWLRRQLDAVAAGADAVAGRVDLDGTGVLPAVAARRDAAAVVRLEAVRRHAPDAEHHHFAGASMALTVRAYRRLGGIVPLVALEDARLERDLRAAGLKIARLADVRVTTSGRLAGRAAAGLAHDLARWDLEARRGMAAADPAA